MAQIHLLLLIEAPETTESKTLISQLSNHYILTITHTLKDAINILKKSCFDIAVMDVYLNGKPEGIQLAEELNKKKDAIPFVFISNATQKSLFIEAKVTKPYSFIIKPIQINNLIYTIELAIERYCRNHNENLKEITCSNSLLIKKNNSIYKLNIHDIEYVEVSDGYLTLHTQNQKFLIRLSLTKLKAYFNQDTFIQVHRKYLVNFNTIQEINLNENTIYLSNGLCITISERYRALLLKEYHILK